MITDYEYYNNRLLGKAVDKESLSGLPYKIYIKDRDTIHENALEVANGRIERDRARREKAIAILTAPKKESKPFTKFELFCNRIKYIYWNAVEDFKKY